MKAVFGGEGGRWEMTELLFTANAERAGPQKDSRDLRPRPPNPSLFVCPLLCSSLPLSCSDAAGTLILHDDSKKH